MLKKFLVASLLLACVFSVDAYAGGLAMKDGVWRLEIQGNVGTNIGKGKHSDDFYAVAELEYEMPFAERWTFALKLIPALIMDQSDPDDEYDHMVYGAGFGIGFRVYQRPQERTGFFLEAGGSAIAHKNRFSGNGSNVNFLTEFGLGYKWRNDWHVTAKWQHISNASTNEDNDGTNAWGLAVGKTF